MDVFLIVIGAICGLIGIVASLIGLDSPQAARNGLIFLFGCFPFLTVGLTMFWRNQFYILRNSIGEAKANVGRKKSQETELKEVLNGLLAKYIEHEKNLLDAAQNHKNENLVAILEKYPDLKANKTIEELIGQLVRLRKEITEAETTLNWRFREYFSWSQQYPYKLFKPQDVDDSAFQYVD